MNSAKLAAALNTLSLAIAEVAEAIAQPGPEREVAFGEIPPATTAPAATPTRALASDVASARATGTVPASEPSPFESDTMTVTWVPPDTLPTEPVGSLAQCPKHHSDYLPSQFKEGAFYCPKDSDDPAWRNSKGKCRITPVNAAEYLRIKAAA